MVQEFLAADNAESQLQKLGFSPKTASYEPCLVRMSLESKKQTIFEKMKGCHEMRFVQFNDISEHNSKYAHQPLQVDYETYKGREKQPEFPFVSPPAEDRPFYDVNL